MFLLTCAEHLADSVEVAELALTASNEVGGAHALMSLLLEGYLGLICYK